MVKEILAIRRREADLQENANLELVYAKKDERGFAYRRGSLLMLCNPSGEEIVIEETSLPKVGEKLFTIGEASYTDGKYMLGKQSFVLWKIA